MGYTNIPWYTPCTLFFLWKSKPSPAKSDGFVSQENAIDWISQKRWCRAMPLIAWKSGPGYACLRRIVANPYCRFTPFSGVIQFSHSESFRSHSTVTQFFPSQHGGIIAGQRDETTCGAAWCVEGGIGTRPRGQMTLRSAIGGTGINMYPLVN